MNEASALRRFSGQGSPFARICGTLQVAPKLRFKSRSPVRMLYLDSLSHFARIVSKMGYGLCGLCVTGF